MTDKFFVIKNYPNDIYNAVGQIIKSAQEWEEKCKKLTDMLKIPVKNIGKSSLNKLNDALKKSGLITRSEYEKLKKVIAVRNYINHTFYLSDFKKSFDGYDDKIKNIEKKLNCCQFLIFEATDLICNKIDELNGSKAMRPTILD